MIAKHGKIIQFLLLIIFSCGLFFFYPFKILAADPSLSVTDISTEKVSGFSIYWSDNLGSVTLERSLDNISFTPIITTTLNYYTDFDVQKSETYTYKLAYGSGVLVATSGSDSLGLPTISNIKIEAGTVGKEEASIIINFYTDKLAKSQVFYGESSDYENQTEVDSSLNQSHTVLVEKLKPNTNYHFKVKASDKTDQFIAQSEDQVFTTPAPPTDQSILQIIIDALTRAFAGFQQWFRS